MATDKKKADPIEFTFQGERFILLDHKMIKTTKHVAGSKYAFCFTAPERRNASFDKCQFCDENAVGKGHCDRYNTFVFFAPPQELEGEVADDEDDDIALQHLIRNGKIITLCDPCAKLVHPWTSIAFFLCEGRRYKFDHHNRMND